MVNPLSNPIYLLSPLVSVVIFFALFILVLVKGQRVFSTWLFCCFLLSISLLSFLVFGMRSSPDVYQAVAWDRAIVVSMLAAFVFYYHFTLAYTYTRVSRAVLYAIYLLLAVAAILVPTTGLFIREMRLADYGYTPVIGPLTPPLSILYLLLVGGGMYNLFRRYRLSLSYNEKNRLAYLVFVGLFPVVGSILDALSPLPPVALWCFIAFGILCTVAVLKHHLLDVNIVVRRGLVYLLTSISVAVPFAVLLYLPRLVFTAYPDTWWSHALIILVLAIILRPLYNWAQQIVDRLFYRGRYDYFKTLRQFSQQAQSVTDLGQISSSLVELVKGALQVSSACILLYSEGKRGLYVVASRGLENPPSGTVLVNRSRIIQWLKSYGDILPLEYFAIFPQLQSLPLVEKNNLERIGAKVLVPIRSHQSELFGIIVLGEKLSEQPYSNEDKQLLVTLSYQMAMALENARLYSDAVQAREHLEGWLNSMTDCVMIMNTDYITQFMNRAAIDKFGNRVGENCWDILRKETVCPSCPIQNYVHGNREELHCSQNVGDREYDIAVSPLLNPDGSLSIIEVLRDITERKQAEEELQKVVKLESVGTLAGGIAHDFNNLLTGIMGNISLARRYVEPKSKVEDSLLAAERASMRAKDLTQQLLTFARGGAPVKKIIPIAELTKDAVTFALRGSNVKCRFSLPDDLRAVEVDEGQMNQVITNLVINADEAMPEGGILNIGAKNTVIRATSVLPLPRGNYIEISIEDQGVGISKEHLARIFEPYFTTKQKGSGLGLATAYSIIKNHDGYITAKSTPFVGTTFHIYFPATKKPASEENEAVAEAIVMGKGRVLVMDDEEMIREMLSDMLHLAGYEVEITSDGIEAIECYSKAKVTGKPFDAVIMDLTIPGGVGGKEAIKKLLEIDPDAKVIVSSGYTTDPIMADFRKYGFSGVVAKPYSIRELEKALHSVITRPGE